MWQRYRRILLAAGILISPAFAGADVVLKVDNVHVRTWNAFADNILKLHQQQVKKLQLTRKISSGGYAQMPDFYIEENFYLGDKLVSKVQWEKANPDLLHAIELNILDKDGRIVRDYMAAFLPRYRNAPVQTLVSLHRHNDGLHAFRSFDASGYRVIERCTGTWQGREVNMLLDEDEIDAAIGDSQGIMVTVEYKACFGDLQTEAGKYLTPQ